jgi:hypothetical protein
MKKSKHAVALTLTGTFISFSNVAHAEPGSLLNTIESSDLSSYIPLVLFALAAIVVYLCNRPRVTVCARARRRPEVSRSES